MQLAVVPEMKPDNELERLRAYSAQQTENCLTATKQVVDTKFTNREACAEAIKSAVLATESNQAAADLSASRK